MKEHNKKRLVVKIGSSLLTQSSGRLSLDKLGHHVDAIVSARDEGHEVVVVSSGAVAAGFESLGFQRRPDAREARQACAAVGQGLLVRAYTEMFGQFGIKVAQVLLTRRDFAVRESYNNALVALEYLIDRKVMPVINENDTVATKNAKFGDNDILAALVATLLHADLLIILTDTAGLYDSDPSKFPGAQRIEKVEEVTPEIIALGAGAGTKVGTGGMEAKLRAAERALSFGVHVFIGDGQEINRNKILDVIEGQGRGTYFGNAAVAPMRRKKQWIAYHSEVRGKIMIDDGAVGALLERGKSLLPVGVVGVLGDFVREDVVEVVDRNGDLVGKGVVQCSSSELSKVKGKATEHAKEVFESSKVEVIHRDNWVRMES